jgi:dienelactone hydrolase
MPAYLAVPTTAPPWPAVVVIRPLRFLARISGTRHDPPATEDAGRRITSFFHEHLGAAHW